RAARAHRAGHEGARRRPDLPDGRPADRAGERGAARLRFGLPLGAGALPDLGGEAGRADHRRALPARVLGVARGGHPPVGLPALHLAGPGDARHLAGRERGAQPRHGRAPHPPDRLRPGGGHDRAGRRGDPSLLHGLADHRRAVRGADVHGGRVGRPGQRARRRHRRPGGRGDPDDVHPGAADPAPEPGALHRLHPGARPAPRRTPEAEMSQAPVDRSASDAAATRRRRIGWTVVLVAAVILPWLLPEQGYTLRVACLILLFAALAQAWNIAAGLSGLISLGHAGFFGAGAYVSTLLLINFGISPWFGMIAALLFGGLLAALLSLPTLRLRGHYFALATLAFGEVMRVIGNSWSDVTGGPVGLSVPFAQPSFAIMSFHSLRPHYFLLLVALVITCLVFERIRRGALGLRLRALKNHPDAAASLGVDTTRAKFTVAVISGAITAVIGVLYAQFMFFFDPDTVFSLAGISVRAALITIIGGMGAVAGPLIGAVLIIPIEELSNMLFSSTAAGLSQLVFGAVLIAVVIWQPRGLLSLFRRFGGRR